MELLNRNHPHFYQHLPTSAGVYVFVNRQRLPIYIGKAVDLKARIKQHFNNKSDPKEQLLAKYTQSVRLFETNSEFEALVLEANFIYKYQPKYNAILKDNKSRLYLVITKESYPKVCLQRKLDLQPQRYRFVFGPLSSVRSTRFLVRRLRTIIPFCTEKTIRSRGCFYQQLGLCNPCPNLIEQVEDPETKRKLQHRYRGNIRRLITLLYGQGTRLLGELKSELKRLAKAEEFERAAEERDRIYYLEQLFQKQLVYDEHLEEANYIDYLRNQENEALRKLLGLVQLRRIEGYDVSNFSFKEAGASMVVFRLGKPQIDQYRRFKIKGRTRFDPEMLQEVLERRLKHKDWLQPDLIVIDGGTPQLLKAASVLRQIKANLPMVIGLAKRPDRIVLEQPPYTIKLSRDHLALHYLERLRDEAHRFAKKYHLHLRRQALQKIVDAVK